MHKRAEFLPIPSWLSVYSFAWLRMDFVAGLTAAAVVIPKAMAYAVIAGLPIEAGLYTALAAMIVYPFFGSSRPLSVTTTSEIAMLTAAQVAGLATLETGVGAAAVASTLALLVGGFLLAARILRLGFIANFVSKPVLVGFEAGIGVSLIVSQLKSVLGVHPASKTTLGILGELPGMLPHTHLLTLCVAFVGIGILFLLPRVWPRLSAPLLWMAASIIAAAIFGFDAIGISLVGAVPSGLPSLSLPDISLAAHLWPAALGIALMSFTESVAAGRTFCKQGDGPIKPNQELVAIGAANVASAFMGGMPAGGGTSQTAVADSAGARTQMAQWVNAAMVLLGLLFLSRVIGLLPQAALGALVIVTGVSLIKPEHFRAIGRIRRDELAWALVTLISVIIIGTLNGILVAVVISVLTLFYQSNHPPVYAVAHNPGKNIFRRFGENNEDVTYPGLLIVRTEGRLTFANAEFVADKMRALIEDYSTRVLIFECSAIPDIEYTALMMLTEAQENLQERGITLWLAALNPDLLKLIERSPLGKILGRERMFFNLPKALEAYKTTESKNAK